MSDGDGILLVADITVKHVSDDLGWITKTERPYYSFDLVDIPDTVRDEIYKLYAATYGSEGMHLTDKDSFDKYNRWVLIRDDATLVAFIVYRTTPWGLKLGVAGNNGSRDGKKAMLTFLTKAFHVQGFYGEISPPLENKLVDKVPLITSEQARIILSKKIDSINGDEYHYIRRINKIGDQVKIVVGKPEVTI